MEQRVQKFETLVKAAMEQCNIGMSLALTGPWEGNQKIEAVLRYVDMLELKAKQNGETQNNTEAAKA